MFFMISSFQSNWKPIHKYNNNNNNNALNNQVVGTEECQKIWGYDIEKSHICAGAKAKYKDICNVRILFLNST